MKDPKSRDEKVYVTNFHYGNNLLEYQDLEVFKRGNSGFVVNLVLWSSSVVSYSVYKKTQCLLINMQDFCDKETTINPFRAFSTF